MKHVTLVISFLCVMLTPLSEPTANDRLPVFVSILPQQFFVQQIGGERVEVRVMVAPGANPATYEPTPRQITKASLKSVGGHHRPP